MAAVEQPLQPIHVEYLPSSNYETKVIPAKDPFRHQSLANSHNHHALHPWGSDVSVGTKIFNVKYAEENNRYMYHLWYTTRLAPFMATEVLGIIPITGNLLTLFDHVIRTVLEGGIGLALDSPTGKSLVAETQKIFDVMGLKPEDRIFVRIGTTSSKDSFAVDVPTTKPSPLIPDGELIIRRLLTSGRVVGRLLALAEKIWPADPGEALVVQRWAPDIELKREIRTFVFEGRVTAISQDVWWEKLGWRERYSDGFVQAIVDLWTDVKDLVPFKTCTMDCLVTAPDISGSPWKAKLLEFNPFGAHLNTGSDLFHWVKDADILHGKASGITVRFVDDWEGSKNDENAEQPRNQEESKNINEEPDWLTLEKRLREKYGNLQNQDTKVNTPSNDLPLGGRWCGAY